MMSMLLWPTAAQFCTFHPTCSVASPLPPDVVFGSLTPRAENHHCWDVCAASRQTGLYDPVTQALGLGPNVRVNQ